MLVGASVAAATLRLATPIALAAFGGVVTERAGVTNIALEASMLVGAFFGIVAADKTGNIWIALGVAILSGMLIALLHAYASITLRSDQIVSGMALNILALGLTTYLDFQLYGRTGTPADLPGLPDVQLGFLSGVPYAGAAFGGQNSMVWVMVVLVVALQVFLFRTVPGLRLRAVGEHPRAAETVGINVRRIRYAAVLASGRAGGARRRVPHARCHPLVHRRDDRWPRLHRARGDDLRALDAGRRARGKPHLRLRERALDIAPGRDDRRHEGTGAAPRHAPVRPDDPRGRRVRRPFPPARRGRGAV